MENHAANPSVPPRHPGSTIALCLILGALFAPPAWSEPPQRRGVVDGQQITHLSEQAVLAQMRRHPATAGATRIEASAAALDSRLAFTPCSKPISVSADLQRLQGRINARVSCTAPSPWTIYVPLELRLFRPVLVTKRDLQRGDTIAAEDIELRERNVLASTAPALTRADEVIGQQVKRPLAAGSLLQAPALEQPVLVRRGDRISVDSAPGTVSVRISGEALGTARRGERVRVKNLQSGRIIDAVVTGNGSAQAI